MKLGITGSATYANYEHFKQVLAAIPVPITLIVTGGLEGVEHMARRYAREQALPVLIHHAAKSIENMTWLANRNTLLVNDADNLLVFNYPGTRTLNMIRCTASYFEKRCNIVYLVPDSTPTDGQPDL